MNIGDWIKYTGRIYAYKSEYGRWVSPTLFVQERCFLITGFSKERYVEIFSFDTNEKYALTIMEEDASWCDDLYLLFASE
jgi:hypothetical protein